MDAAAESERLLIQIRKVALPFPAALDPLLIEGQPEESYLLVGLSLLLPFLEPYLIRSIRAARDRIGSPDLVRQVDLFNGQEGQHYRQHLRFNQALQLHPAHHRHSRGCACAR